MEEPQVLAVHPPRCPPAHIEVEMTGDSAVRRTVPHDVRTGPASSGPDGSRMMPADRRARLMRLATLRAVDAYFHKVRSNLRFAARPAHTPSGNGRAWDRHYLYNPETMVKVVEIYRFSHNWMGSNATRVTPAMRLGLAKGKIYPRDLFA